ncbi:MAG: hypothetical protein BGO31_11010 [Bacteroidetes bacterium 43-16]|uniref:hypothetical protein n=1 Tax=uncultured Dysgonomonas sp. TaxID=206096 RepID=UPI000928E187|nr:hypothetical protein [uncultured Dysgonomonas sp.]OJV50989.1 MAG: hypothetical protein BGO31_11010 [Bacteroidetes bacterium 43-16]
MQEITELKIPYEELKHLTIEVIRNSGNSFQFKSIANAVGHFAVNQGIVANPNQPGFQALSFPLQQVDENRLRQILWDLIIERVLTIGDYHNDSWPWLSVTDYGRTALLSTDPIPNDPSGYLERVKRDIPDLDEIIETYLSESIRTYNINQLLSATITLGCASERALIVLIECFADTYVDDAKQSGFKKKITGKFIKSQFDVFDSHIKPLLTHFPYELRENYANTLHGVFQMIRNNRNDAGHPTGIKMDKEALFANLQVFIPYCKYIYGLMDYLRTNHHN